MPVASDGAGGPKLHVSLEPAPWEREGLPGQEVMTAPVLCWPCTVLSTVHIDDPLSEVSGCSPHFAERAETYTAHS